MLAAGKVAAYAATGRQCAEGPACQAPRHHGLRCLRWSDLLEMGRCHGRRAGFPASGASDGVPARRVFVLRRSV